MDVSIVADIVLPADYCLVTVDVNSSGGITV